VHVPPSLSQESECSCICVLFVSILPLPVIFLFGIGTGVGFLVFHFILTFARISVHLCTRLLHTINCICRRQ